MSRAVAFLGRQLFVTPRPVDPKAVNLTGQVGIVTGANVGLGYEAARQLLALGLSKLVIAVRNQARGDEAKHKLAALYPSAEIEVSLVDLASYESIKAFVSHCEALPRLDFAILNAGVVKFKYEVNPSTKHEETIQVNVLSTALLASLLLPKLSKSNPNGPGKITITGSEVADFAAFKQRKSFPILPQLDDEKIFDSNEQYCVSKLLLQYFVIQAAKVIDPNKVILNVVNPGFCYGSALHRDVTGVSGIVLNTVKRGIGRTCEVGARPIVKAAVLEGKTSHGQYYSDNAVARLAPLAQGAVGARLSKQTYGEIIAELKQFGAEQSISSVRRP